MYSNNPPTLPKDFTLRSLAQALAHELGPRRPRQKGPVWLCNVCGYRSNPDSRLTCKGRKDGQPCKAQRERATDDRQT